MRFLIDWSVLLSFKKLSSLRGQCSISRSFKGHPSIYHVFSISMDFRSVELCKILFTFIGRDAQVWSEGELMEKGLRSFQIVMLFQIHSIENYFSLQATHWFRNQGWGTIWSREDTAFWDERSEFEQLEWNCGHSETNMKLALLNIVQSKTSRNVRMWKGRRSKAESRSISGSRDCHLWTKELVLMLSDIV
jgi:hypothetical protein